MNLEIRIAPHQNVAYKTDFYTMRITLRYRGRVYHKEDINRLPELHSMMDYLFEAARREMKAAILAYMQTGSPVSVEGLEQKFLEDPLGGE